MHRQIAGKLTGPVTKWIVLAVSILSTVVSGLPRRPSSTTSRTTSSRPGSPPRPSPPRVAEEISGEIDPNDIPTLVVYHRDGGLTEADLAAIEEHGAEIAGARRVVTTLAVTPGGQTAGLLVRGRRGRLHLLHVQLRQGRLEQARGAGQRHQGPHRDRRRRRPHRRLRRPGLRLHQLVRRVPHHAAADDLRWSSS